MSVLSSAPKAAIESMMQVVARNTADTACGPIA